MPSRDSEFFKSRTTAAREALIAEALGDMVQVIDRLEKLLPAMEKSEQKMTAAGARLSAHVSSLEARMEEVTGVTKTHVVQYVKQQTAEAAQRAQQSMLGEMRQALVASFETEAQKVALRLIEPLLQQRGHFEHDARYWTMHAGICLGASSLLWMLLALLFPR